MNNLSKIKVGQQATVKDLVSTGKARQRMIDMGIYSGVKLVVTNTAPFGDPMEIKLKDFSIAIRKSDAAKIIVE